MSMSSQESIPSATTGLNISVGKRALLLALNSIPLFHLTIIAWTTIFFPSPVLWHHFLGGFSALFLAPPLFGRLILALRPIHSHEISIGSHEFFTWWALANLQGLFGRFPFLEEGLRLVPGLYSLWLRLWGARIGRLTFWAPGTRLLDRSFLDIGDEVVLGAGVRLNPHVISKKENGDMVLLLAPVHIGHRAFIGGYSLLTAGTEIAEGECTKAYLLSPPFSKWKGNKRIHPTRQ